MKEKLLFTFTGFIVLILFTFFSYLVDINIFRQFDFNTTVRLQDNIPRKVDDELSLLSDIGSFEPMLIVVVGLVVFLTFKKKFYSFLLIISFGILHLFELYGKYVVEQLPPPQFMLRTKHLFEFPQFHVRSEYSYPSGHAGRALFITTVIGIILLNHKKLSKTNKIIFLLFLVLYDVIMLISRVYLGEHWTTDAIGGFILGFSLAIFSSIVL